MLLASAAPNVALEAVLLVPVGMSVIVFVATANSTLQLSADDAMRGRVMALYALVFLGSTPIGGPVVGWISEQFGPRAGLVVGGVAALAVAVPAAFAATAGRRRADLRPPHLDAVEAGDAVLVSATAGADLERTA